MYITIESLVICLASGLGGYFFTFTAQVLLLIISVFIFRFIYGQYWLWNFPKLLICALIGNAIYFLRFIEISIRQINHSNGLIFRIIS
jgi:hypothetical protein